MISERMSGARQLFDDLWAERRRVALVALGVLWGTLGLTVLLASGKALVEAMHQSMDAGGRDFLRVWARSTSLPHAGLPAGRRLRLRVDDDRFVEQAVPGVRAAAVEYTRSRQPVRLADGSRHNLRVHGVSADFCTLRHFVPAPGRGRPLHHRDVAEHRRVVFAGHAVARRLFGQPEPAVGRTVEIAGQPFTIVGVRDDSVPLGNYSGMDADKLLIPATTFRDLFGVRNPSYLLVGLTAADLDARVEDGLRQAFARRDGFAPEDRRALGFANVVARNRDIDAILDGTRWFMLIIGVLALLVAIVGVGNIMFVLVDERTREFGILLALGARPGRLLQGRVVEAITITAVGGLAGIVASALFFAAYAELPIDATARAYLGTPRLSLPTAATVALVLGVAGGVAGWFPARRAALVDPVEVLHDD